MKAICPQCRAAISVENINVENDVAVCQLCAEIVSLSSLIKGKGAAAGGVSIPPSFDLNNPPDGAWYNETLAGFTVGATTRCLPLLLFLVPFTLVWSGGSIGGIYGSQIMSGKFDLFLSLFGLPFLAGSVLLICTILMAFAGKIVVEVDSGMGTVFMGFAGIGWKRRFQWDEVDVVMSDISFSNRRNLQHVITLEGATRIQFGTGLSEARRFFLLNALKTLKASQR